MASGLCRTLVVGVSAVVMLLTSCSSDSDTGSETAPTEATVSPDEATMSPSESNAQVQDALAQQGLEVCPSEDANGYVIYPLPPCERGVGDILPNHVLVYSYRTADAQESDLTTRDADLGLVGWTWELNTVIVTDDVEADAVDKVEAAMNSLGAEIGFDGRDFAG